jgi:hypothetical protein
LANLGTQAPVSRDDLKGLLLAQLLKRPEFTIEQLTPLLRELAPDFFRRPAPRACSVADRSTPAPLDSLLPAFQARGPAGEGAPCPPAFGERGLGSPTPFAVDERGESAVDSGAPSLPAVGKRADVDISLRADEVASRLWSELKSVETEIKYAGYLGQQQKAIERLKRSEQRVIPDWFDYSSVSGLSREMKEKLQQLRPQTIGQASRIPGVTPAAVSLVNVFLEIQARRRPSPPA